MKKKVVRDVQSGGGRKKRESECVVCWVLYVIMNICSYVMIDVGKKVDEKSLGSIFFSKSLIV